MATLRTVLVGCGGISNAWFDSLKDRKDVEFVGLVDINREAAEKMAAKRQFDNVEIGTDLSAVLKRTGAQLVLDCTVPEAHCDVTVTALRHGCHVFGEKPLADTMPNARKMVAAAAKARKVYAVMQNRRYLPQMKALRAFLDSGAIGQVTTMHCDFFIGAHFGGFRDRMKHVLLLDMAIHTFDQARYLSGLDPIAATAVEWNPPGSWYDHDASAVAVFEMTDKAVFCYRGSWCAEGLNTSWESQWRIIGQKGTVSWDGGNGFRAQAKTGDEGFTRPMADVAVPFDQNAPGPHGHAGCLADMLDCIAGRRVPQTICSDNIKSLSMVHAAIESAMTGKKVKCNWDGKTSGRKNKKG